MNTSYQNEHVLYIYIYIYTCTRPVQYHLLINKSVSYHRVYGIVNQRGLKPLIGNN